jgi:hypothetical protein
MEQKDNELMENSAMEVSTMVMKGIGGEGGSNLSVDSNKGKK